MRDALSGIAITTAAIAQLAAALLLAWLGGTVYFLFDGTFLFLGRPVLGLDGSFVWPTVWFAFGPLLVLPAISPLRLPFILLGYLLAALAGRTDDYSAAIAELNNR